MKTIRLLPMVLLLGIATLGLPGFVAKDLVAQIPMHNCSFCHSLHGGSYSQLTEHALAEDLCLSCHGDAGPATVDRDGVQVAVPKSGRNDDGNTFVVHNGAKHTAQTGCRDCHDHEGEAGLNFKMIPEQVLTPNSGPLSVVLTAWTGTNSFADGDATYDGVCEVCHTATDFHKNIGPPGSHNFTDDCTACHLHGSGFAGAGGGCAGCHSSGQGGRRAIVGEFDRTTHHVDWAGGGLANSGEIPDSDCTTCHDQSAHQAGNVRLWDVDDPTNTAASVVLTGDPSTSSTEAAKLSAHCLSCHDADGANGNTTPFTGGATVSPIDNTAWAASSHEGSAAIVGCYGNGTFGCHASGHGSEKLNMLTPANAAATAPAYAEEEEGFCFNCHDSDGPAGTDMEAVWGEPINWTTLAAGSSSITTFNDRHDVQQAAQATSGALIECSSCHNPHGDNASQPYRLDPDPADGHVVGTDWYFTEYQTAGDLLSEFCLDCHDGSLATGTSGHTGGALNDVENTWASDGMGSGTGGRPSAHALTHAHFDHQGGSHAVCESFGVPLWCGAGDREAAETGDWTGLLPRPDGWVARLAHRLAGPGHPVARVLAEGDRIGDFTVLETPGHTPGHLAFWRERDRVLILGDVLFHRNPVTRRLRLREPFGFATREPSVNRESARKLAALEPTIVCFGHGEPLTEGTHFQEFVADLPC